MRGMFLRAILAGCVLAGLSLPSAAAAADEAGTAVRSVASGQLAQAAAATQTGGAVRLEGVRVGDTGEAAAFDLERFEVFASDAEIVVHGDGGRVEKLPAPANVYFRGNVEGEPGSRVFLAVHEDGRTQGIVDRGGDTYLIGADDDLPADPRAKAAGVPLEMRRIEPLALKSTSDQGFACGNTALPQNQHPMDDLTAAVLPTPEEKAVAAALPAHTARVAIETDFEFYQLFNNTTTATNYIGNLLGYASSVAYVPELNTSLLVSSVSLWTTSNDPWGQTSSTLCGLLEFGKYWNVNKTGVPRTIAHFMSGKPMGGGIAWLGVLCSGGFSTGAASSCPGLGSETTPWGGGYGFTASLTGGFNVASPTVMWDIMAVAHEIGHNFNSPHTHCYANIGGSASPIDQCYSGESGCYSGTTSLPGPSGAHSGTIMSYCHLRGGYSNVAMSFGTAFPFGVQPGREAQRMNSHISSVASGNPSCLAFTAGSANLFTDGFESGVLSAWQ